MVSGFTGFHFLTFITVSTLYIVVGGWPVHMLNVFELEPL